MADSAAGEVVNERCWALTGGRDGVDGRWRIRLRRPVSGQPSSVEADWAWALAREEAYGDLAGFAHTHPQGAGTKPSKRDIRTMRAWCSALGKPLLCLIAEGAELTDPAAFIFNNDRSRGKRTERFEIVYSEEKKDD